LSHFSSLDLCKPILDAITAQGYETPTLIQTKAIPPGMAGRDLLGCAQTGTGKTAAFALPILHRLHSVARTNKKQRGPVLPRALILSPTRELACQIEESFKTYGQRTRLRQTVVYGGVNQYHQVRRLQQGVDILVATPGRLMDLMAQGHVILSNIEIFVLDEADRMLDMGFIDPIRRIAAALPKKRQTLLFSATMPRSIMHLANSLLDKPVNVQVKPEVATTRLIDQSVYMVSRAVKPALVEHLLVEHGVDRGLIFTRTKYGADKLTRRLKTAGVTATAIHGNKTQKQRQQALASFRSGKSRVLVATDVAARGLDVDGISHVFNFDLPHEPEAYVHRIGRTGRAGSTGVAISFCDRNERGHLQAIERFTGNSLPSKSKPGGLDTSSDSEDSKDNNRSGESRPKAPFKPKYKPKQKLRRNVSSGNTRSGSRGNAPGKGPKRSNQNNGSGHAGGGPRKRNTKGGAKGSWRSRRRSA